MGQQEAYEKQLLALEGVIQTLREEQDIDVLIQTTLNYLEAEFNYRLIWIGLYDRPGNQLLGKGGITPTPDQKLLRGKFTINPGDLLDRVITQQRTVAIADLREESQAGQWQRAAQKYGIQGTLLFPLLSRGQCMGAILLGSHLWGTTPRAKEKAQLSLVVGALATALHQIDLAQEQTSTQRSEHQMFEMLDQLQRLPTLTHRLEMVVNLTHEFIAPGRTHLYWYSPERRFFWLRTSYKQKGRQPNEAGTKARGLTVLDVSDFYLALAADQVVALGDGKSPLKLDVVNRVLSQLRSHSLLAAPIVVRKDLLGFLAVEGDFPRTWKGEEQNFIRAAASAIALIAGSEDVEEALESGQQDAQLMSEIANAIATESDSQAILFKSGNLVLNRLGVTNFIVVQESDRSTQNITSPDLLTNNNPYQIVSQNQPHKRRSLPSQLNSLNVVDRQLLKGSQTWIAIEDWEKDEHFKEWREALTQLGVRSLVVCRITAAQASGLLIIGHSNPRTWSQKELKLIDLVSQEIGIVLNGLQIQSAAENASISLEILEAGLVALLNAPADPFHFERAWLLHLAQSLECPLVTLLAWKPQNRQAKVVAAMATDPTFRLAPDLAIPVASDALLRDAIASNSILCRKVADLPNETRQWLNAPENAQVLVMALPLNLIPEEQLRLGWSSNTSTPTQAPNGLILIVDPRNRQWLPNFLRPLETLMRQFVGLRHYRRFSAVHSRDLKEIEQLNWYKHKCLETLYQAVGSSIKGLLELDVREAGDSSVRRIRTAQILRSLEGTLASLNTLVNQEQWQLQTRLVPFPLEDLLKRSIRRVEPLYNQRQILIRVHTIGNVNILTDRPKLEYILFDILMMFCDRVRPQSRLDLWCRVLSEDGVDIEQSQPSQPVNIQPLVELLITDNELVQPLTETNENNLEGEPYIGLYGQFVTSKLEQPANLNLTIGQRILRSWGGDVQFYTLENGHFLTRLTMKTVDS